MDLVATDGQAVAGPPDAVADRALGAGDPAGQDDGDVGMFDHVVPRRGDDVPEERRPPRRVTGRRRELLVGAGAARVEDTVDGVADPEDVAAVVEVVARVANLGHPEAFSALPLHLVGHRAVVHEDLGDPRFLTDMRAVEVGDVPVPEDAVPPAGEIAGDDLGGVQPAVGVDDELGVVVGDDHRVRRRAALRAAGEHQRPQQPNDDEQQGDREPDDPAGPLHLASPCQIVGLHPMCNGSIWTQHPPDLRTHPFPPRPFFGVPVSSG